MQNPGMPMTGVMQNPGMPMTGVMQNPGMPMTGVMQNPGMPMTGVMQNPGMPMTGVMQNPGMPMTGIMQNPGMPMTGVMQNPGMAYYGIQNPMYTQVNPGFYNPNMGNNGMGMGMANQNGLMVNMYPMNQGGVNPYNSNPNVPIQNNPNVIVPNTSNSTPTVQISNINNNNQGNANGEAPPSILSRDTQLVGETVIPANGIINVFFEASTGSRAVINIPEDTSIKEALEKYAEKINLNKQYLTNNKIIFLFSNQKLDANSTDSIKSKKILNNCKINVFDQGNVLGA
jgi:hypothetical protein